MLRRLELIGFKSFAERTRFEFAPGITAIVGPNGSGKSNIVDAVRWLLGEQSAKNLRGGEMTDVIFNGSSTRKSLGLAEVSMTFDNSKRILNIDSDEIQITRRVFRDGEGEYLINSQLVRLKDIKELFLGSGAGHSAYSVIEQGRVDSLLAASTKERRIIFEEAAGISRFKLKKQEALRKLESVHADLNRVQDIARELDKQLKTLRQQATKAQKYREYQQRLRELRIASSAEEVHHLQQQIQRESQIVQQLRAELDQAADQSREAELHLQELEQKLAALQQRQQVVEAEFAEHRKKTARLEGQYSSEIRQLENLNNERLRLVTQRSESHWRLQRCERELGLLRESLSFAEQRLRAEQIRSETASHELQQATACMEQLSQTLNVKREEQLQAATQSAKIQNACQNTEQQLRTIEQSLRQKQTESLRLSNRHSTLTRLLEELSNSDAGLRERLEMTRLRLSQLQGEHSGIQAQEQEVRKRLEALRERRSALRGRKDVLESLEHNFEGLGAGVRFVLEKINHQVEPFSSCIVGLVADLIRVRRDDAAIVELALGDAAQRFIVRDTPSMERLIPYLNQLPGRVGFIPLKPRDWFVTPPPLVGKPLMDLVSCNIPSVLEQLFQTVWLVKSLEDAQLCQVTHPSWRFVTLSGELLDRDGTLLVGPAEQRVHLLSRKSELREVIAELQQVESEILASEQQQDQLLHQAASLSLQCQEADDELSTITFEAGSLREQLLTQGQQRDQLAEAISLLAQEQELFRQQHDQLRMTLAQLQGSLNQSVAEEDRLRAELNDYAEAFKQAESIRETRNQEYTTAQIALSRVAEQVQALQGQVHQLESNVVSLAAELARCDQEISTNRNQLTSCQLAALKLSASVAQLYHSKQFLETDLRGLFHSQTQWKTERDSLHLTLRHAREVQAKQRDVLHTHDLALHEQTSRRDAILARIQEEFGVDLLGRSQAPESADQPEWTMSASATDAAQEIAELRAKLARLGPVNLEALSELAQHEQREAELRKQLFDLSDSHKKLVQIIEQMNHDSRRLMSETIQQVREQFQNLFRKLFSGGQADIVLEDESDLLESGIEITVRPPGKETQRLSLLSGGERALTAVALLLAIFRCKPSPFCLLDEVDAAMDEGNTLRLANLLREFSDQSQFIIITHKKRTMAAADVLYGVTMQESGVSKLVAVRFEDWQEPSNANRNAA